jgi:hypothetical protein
MHLVGCFIWNTDPSWCYGYSYIVLNIQTSDLTSGRDDAMARSNPKSNVENRRLNLTGTLTECPKQQKGVPSSIITQGGRWKEQLCMCCSISTTITLQSRYEMFMVCYTHEVQIMHCSLKELCHYPSEERLLQQLQVQFTATILFMALPAEKPVQITVMFVM